MYEIVLKRVRLKRKVPKKIKITAKGFEMVVNHPVILQKYSQPTLTHCVN